MCMSSVKTKEILIEIVSTYLLEQFNAAKNEHQLMVTSKSPSPETTRLGIRIKRDDLQSFFDEADYIIPQQVHAAINEGKKAIKVISADTDVFVLLCAMWQIIGHRQKYTWKASKKTRRLSVSGRRWRNMQI